MPDLSNVFSQIQAADMLWIAGAVILGLLALKVAAKLLKFVLLAAAVVLLVVFLMSAGILPAFF